MLRSCYGKRDRGRTRGVVVGAEGQGVRVGDAAVPEDTGEPDAIGSGLRVDEAEERLHEQMNIAPQVEEDHTHAQEELQRLKVRTANGEQRLEVETFRQVRHARASRLLDNGSA